MLTYFPGNESMSMSIKMGNDSSELNKPPQRGSLCGGYHNLVPHDHPNGASPVKSINVKPGQSLWIWGSSESDDWLINLDGMDMNGYTVIWVWVKIRYPNNWMVNTKLD